MTDHLPSQSCLQPASLPSRCCQHANSIINALACFGFRVPPMAERGSLLREKPAFSGGTARWLQRPYVFAVHAVCVRDRVDISFTNGLSTRYLMPNRRRSVERNHWNSTIVATDRVRFPNGRSERASTLMIRLACLDLHNDFSDLPA